MTWTIVMRMHSVLTQRGVSLAPAILAILEMESTVQVRYSFISLHRNIIGAKYVGSVIQPTRSSCTPIHLLAFILQISMSVNWRYIHAIPVPTVLTQMAASTVHVGKALRVMGLPVQVCKISILLLSAEIIIIKYLVADIPECERELDDCDPNATCTNTIGGYICTCNIGFTGDGYMCLG